jgi:sigma-B regulation protein RsbU (phosphoserine phosphatase)
MNRLLLDYQCTAELAAAGQLRNLLRQVLVSSVQDKSLHHKILLCLSEIISNIARYNQPPAAQICVRFEQTEQNWELRISDNGNCYDPARHEVQDLAEVHPDSESGRGIALILACCDRIDYLPGDADKPNLTVCSWTSNWQKNRRRILIVEDEATSRRLYTHYLNELYEVFEARNGEEALEVLGSADIDLILSDINMPTMDGLTLRSEITQNSEYELIPFVFLTASEDDDLCGRAASLGIDDYLVKPVDKAKLVSVVKQQVAAKKGVAL